MVFSTDSDETKSVTTFSINSDKKLTDSKTSNEKFEEAGEPKKAASQVCKKNLKAGSKPPEMDGPCDSPNPAPPTGEPSKDKQVVEKLDKMQEEAFLEGKKPEREENQKTLKRTTPTEEMVAMKAETNGGEAEPQKKVLVGSGKVGRYRGDLQCKRASERPSEIPKLKSLSKVTQKVHPKVNAYQSKLPVKTPEKEFEQRQSNDTLDGTKTKADSLKAVAKVWKPKKETKPNDKIRQAMEADFSYLVPLYEKEFRKISDVWTNTMYCSLTMRTNLVKLLFQAFPHINREQFHMEDEKLLQCIARAKSCTKMEAQTLVKFLKNLVANREKFKEEYSGMLANKEIAEFYNHDWRKLIRKVTDLEEEAKLLQMETPELQKKKEANEVNMNEKIRRMEMNLCKKEDEIKKLVNQLNVLKQKEVAYKENVLLKIPDYKEIKADVNSLISTQKEFDELRAKYLLQNYSYEKKIKDLENLLEEKKKVLDKERDVKMQLQGLLAQLQTHQKELTTTVGKEQIDYVMGRSMQGNRKRREQLWLAAVKLVLRGFLVQMKKLERDRNKMLLELQSNDLENLADFANIIQKDNFIRSIRQQMCDLQKLCNSPNVKCSPI